MRNFYLFAFSRKQEIRSSRINAMRIDGDNKTQRLASISISRLFKGQRRAG